MTLKITLGRETGMLFACAMGMSDFEVFGINQEGHELKDLLASNGETVSREKKGNDTVWLIESTSVENELKLLGAIENEMRPRTFGANVCSILSVERVPSAPSPSSNPQGNLQP